MKGDQNTVRLSRRRSSEEDPKAPQAEMVNPALIKNARNLGPPLQETGVEALGLEGTSVKKLQTARIYTIEQLAGSDETTLLHIPHFGVGKVNKIRACLNSYLTSILEGDTPLVESSDETLDAGTPESAIQYNSSADLPPKISSHSVGSLSKRISRLERRMGSLESRLIRIEEDLP